MAQKKPILYDKVETKKKIKHYVIMAICIVPIILVLNFTLFLELPSVWRIVLDVIIILGLIFVIDGFLKSRAEKKEEKAKEKLNGKQ